MPVRHLVRALGALPLLALAVGCTATVEGTGTAASSSPAMGSSSAEESAAEVPRVSPEIVEETSEVQLETQVGERPVIECPDSLEGVVGATLTCLLTDDTGAPTYDVVMTVTSVDGVAVLWDVEVAEQPNP